MSLTTHTHELRFRGEKGEPTVLVKGTYEECLQHVGGLAKQKKCGAGLLLTNGGYCIASLETEKNRKIEKAAPEMYEALKLLMNEYDTKGHLLGFDISIARKAIQKAVV